MNTVDFDGASEYDNATNFRFTAGSTGYYLVTVGFYWTDQ